MSIPLSINVIIIILEPIRGLIIIVVHREELNSHTGFSMLCERYSSYMVSHSVQLLVPIKMNL